MDFFKTIDLWCIPGMSQKKCFLQQQSFGIFVIWLYCFRVTVTHSLILNSFYYIYYNLVLIIYYHLLFLTSLWAF